jgi:acetylornithine deacetylase/succinyl-diaminopimelate desuccinylase-like protein
MDKRIIKPYVEKFFNFQILPNLMDFIRIPNCSPNYDPDWETNGNALKAANFLCDWVDSLSIKGCTATLLKDRGHTPFLYIEIASTKPDDDRTILLYGHMDKQPAFTGWSEDLGPQNPVIKDNKLYGRGSSDDGYAIFASITAVKACQDNDYPIPRIAILIEGAEESNTVDLLYYVQQLKPVIGDPSLIICLDSGCEDYERLWVTTSLRGVFTIDLKVSVLSQGIHSGVGGGIVPDTFMIMRQLLDRVENQVTADIIEKSLLADLPKNREEEINDFIKIAGEKYLKNFPWYKTTRPLDYNIKDIIIRNTWKPALVITGAEGFPELETAGNLILPSTSLRLSMRLPPSVDSKKCAEIVKGILVKDPPYGSKVEANILNTGDGWNLYSFSTRLKNILNISSQRFFNNNIAFFGEGGSIPFVQIFNSTFTKADIAVFGVCGPDSNIHGPNESLNLEFVQKLIMCLTYLVSEY